MSGPKPGKPLVIQGIVVPPELRDVAWAWKKRDIRGMWSLLTVDGRRLAMFISEERLQSWWKQFQRAEGREPRPVAVSQKQLDNRMSLGKKKARKKSAGRKEKAQSKKPLKLRTAEEIEQARACLRRQIDVCSSPAGDHPAADPKRPWSDDYDMPEYDFE